MVLRKSFYIHWSAGRSPRVHEVNPGRDPSSVLYRDVEERTVSSHILILTGIVLSQNPGIPVSGGNPSSCVQAADNGSILSTPPDRQLSSVPGPDGRNSGTLTN